MPADRLNQSFALVDGRTLGYAEYGSKSGLPVFYFTGGNSSRFEGQWLETAATRNQVRLIVPDRPGFGLSDFLPGRRLLGWPEDVMALADHLEIETFSIVGLSGGGPHVLATARRIPERIRRVAVVSGTAPPEMPRKYQGMWPPVQLIFLTARYAPPINRFLLKQMAGFYSNPVEMKKRMVQAMPEPDIALIQSRPEVIDIFARATKEAHRNGVEGDAWEWQMYVQPWGFTPTDIQLEVKLWYGLYDRQVPIGMGRYLAAQLPRSELREVENGGHFSTINNHIDEILSYLAGTAEGR